MKTIRDIEAVLETGVKAVTLRARTTRMLIARSKKRPVSDKVTGRLRRAMYRAGQSLRRVADMLDAVKDQDQPKKENT
jgi:hypothetical protein